MYINLPHAKIADKMSSENNKLTNPKYIPDEGEMIKCGIKRVPVDYFHYREFRYTNLKDAIMQAKRDETCHEDVSAS